MGPFDVPEVLNVFMNPQLHEGGTYEFRASPIEAGDFFAMRVEMDVWSWRYRLARTSRPTTRAAPRPSGSTSSTPDDHVGCSPR
jgi:hypothetical protein